MERENLLAPWSVRKQRSSLEILSSEDLYLNVFLKVKTDSDGRFMRIDCQILEVKLCLINVYSPVIEDRHESISEV